MDHKNLLLSLLSSYSYPNKCEYYKEGAFDATNNVSIRSKPQNEIDENYRSYLYGYAKVKASLDSQSYTMYNTKDWPLFASYVYQMRFNLLKDS